MTNEAGVLRAAPSLVIVAGAQVQHDKWSSGEGIESFPMFSHDIPGTDAHRINPFICKGACPEISVPFRRFAHFRRKTISHLHFVKRIQTSAQRLGFSMLLRPAHSVSSWNDTFKGCGAQTGRNYCRMGWGGWWGEGHNTVENAVETKNI